MIEESIRVRGGGSGLMIAGCWVMCLLQGALNVSYGYGDERKKYND